METNIGNLLFVQQMQTISLLNRVITVIELTKLLNCHTYKFSNEK